LLAAAWLMASLLMLALWIWHLSLRNAAVVDVGWAAGLALVAVVDAVLGVGDPVRRWLAALMMAVWGGRLALYLLTTRVLGHEEDARYAALRQVRGRGANRWFFWFFQAQALLVALLSWPVAVATSDPNPTIPALTWIGVALWFALRADGRCVAPEHGPPSRRRRGDLPAGVRPVGRRVVAPLADVLHGMFGALRLRKRRGVGRLALPVQETLNFALCTLNFRALRQ
jgi:uncharacterized membrane protein